MFVVENETSRKFVVAFNHENNKLPIANMGDEKDGGWKLREELLSGEPLIVENITKLDNSINKLCQIP